MADRITWYDILGIAAGASAETVQLAYQAKAKQLHGYQIGDAPAYVAEAASRGQKAIDAAWLVLGSRAQREQYDEQIGIKTKGAGLERPQPTTSRPGSGLLDAAANALSGAPDALYIAADALDSEVVLVGLGVLAGLLAAIPAPGYRADQRPVTVPGRAGRVLPGFSRRAHDGWLSRQHCPPDRKSDAGRRSGRRPVTRARKDCAAIQYADRAGVASVSPGIERTIGAL